MSTDYNVRSNALQRAYVVINLSYPSIPTSETTPSRLFKPAHTLNTFAKV